MSNTQAIGVAYADPALNSFEDGQGTGPIDKPASGNLSRIALDAPYSKRRS